MSKKKNTLIALEAALSRVVEGNPKRIPVTRKLSVRAIEEETNLGNGSGYYYPEFVEKVKKTKAEMAANSGIAPRSDTERLRAKAKQETRIKEKYKQEKDELKAMVARMAAEHHHLNDALRKALVRIDELEQENSELTDKLVEARRNSITSIY